MKPEAKQPFFILGSQRSGTTMLRLMINRHRNLAVPHETGFMTSYLESLHEYGNLSNRENQSKLLDDIIQHKLVVRGEHIQDKKKILEHDIGSFADLIDAIMSEYASSRGKPRWGDKTPYYTPDIDLLWNLFPGCKIIHLVRDGRDAVLSQLRMEWMSNSLPVLAQNWARVTTICHKVGSVLGEEHFLELKYEDLVQQPEATLRQICDFLGEDFDKAMLQHEKDADAVVPDESHKWHSHSVKAPDKSKLYGWKSRLSQADQIIFQQAAGDALRLFGYECTGAPSSLSSKLKNLYYATVQRW